MPASRPRASFEPISPDFDLGAFIETNDQFEYAARISVDKIEEEGLELFEKLVLLHVIQGGKPLVVDGFEKRLDPWLFTPKWLSDNHEENARNLTTQENIPLTIRHYLSNLGKLTEQFFKRPDSFKEKNKQRVYLKDIDCPSVWQEKLRDQIPQSLFYYNNGTGEIGGPGAVDEPLPGGAGWRKGKGIAPAGDLMSSLPQDMRAENLMCYIGHEGTYTPSHKEMCASLGHNIMVNASEAFDEDGQPERPGSSIWFMTETKDRYTVAEFWLSVLGHDIEVEKHFAQLAAWQRAPFKVYVVEQRAGDFILVPPLAPHQVWNRGTRTIKVAWNRTTAETLEMAMHEAIPNARMVCRDEQYKNKSIIYYTLIKYSDLLRKACMLSSLSGRDCEAIAGSKKVRQVQKDFRRLFELFKEILLSESFSPGSKEQIEHIPYDSNITCSYCRGNIFNRFLTCKTCIDAFNTGIDEPYDMCMDCFAMGRSCACQSNYHWVEQWQWEDLLAHYEEWRSQIMEMDGGATGKAPLSLEEERKLQPKKTLAEVCQEELRHRPWVNINQPNEGGELEVESDEGIIVNDDGKVQKTKKIFSKAYKEKTKPCHSCCHRHPHWMTAECTMCERGWCYGVLWRAYDLHPLTVMEDLRWECPHCQRICSTGTCRRDPRQQPYEPKGTLLGHDTKKIADVRSVECLVDFSKANLNFLGESVDGSINNNETRLQRRQLEAEMARMNDSGMLDEDRYADEYEDGSIHHDQEVIDPALGGGSASERRSNDLYPVTEQDSASSHAVGTLDAPIENMLLEERLSNGFAKPSIFLSTPLADNEMDLDAPLMPPIFSKKRGKLEDSKQIKVVSPKKRKTADSERSQPKTNADKQYLSSGENKRLEQGRKRIVRLNIDGEKLREIISRPQMGVRPRTRLPDSMSPNILLNTDVLAQTTIQANANTIVDPTAGKRFRVRVEKDIDFRNSKRHRRKDWVDFGALCYEEYEIESDEEHFTEDPTGSQRGPRRSEWLLRKAQDGDEDIPNELPENFKDGSVNQRQRQTGGDRAGKKKTMPVIMDAPKIHPLVTASKGAMPSVGAATPNSNEKRGSSSRMYVKAEAVELVKAALYEEDSRKAELLAAGILLGRENIAGGPDDFKNTRTGPANDGGEPVIGRQGMLHIMAPGGHKHGDRKQEESTRDCRHWGRCQAR